MNQDIRYELPIDILVAKLQNDLLSEENMKCHIHCEV